jgi:hypothetical protein
MKERPIIMSAPMVRAILDGRKTQTRRVVKGVRMFSAEYDARWNPHAIRPGGACPDSWTWWEGPAHGPSIYHQAACPYGRPGDRLWVREAWRAVWSSDAEPPRSFDAAYRFWYEADAPLQDGYGKLRSSIHMPRCASRITLEVTGVRVDRLQNISQGDSMAEGITHSTLNDPRVEYRWLWEQINGPGSWSANPWVWVIEFKRAAQRGEGE